MADTAAPQTVWIVDRQGDVAESCRDALAAAGWQVRTAREPADVSEPAAAVVLANELAEIEHLRDRPAIHTAAVVLVTSLDRSGWDRTFQDETAFDVDAVLDRPVDVEALVARLRGILAARDAVAPHRPPTEFREIIQRAIANEEAAERFYRKAADACRTFETRAVLEDLAHDEQGHKQILLELMEGKRSLPAATTAPGSVLETFGTPDLTPDMSAADAFLLAARKEKMAVELYENWARLYPAGPDRDLLLQLAEVERRHKAHVEQMFTNASFPEDFFEPQQ